MSTFYAYLGIAPIWITPVRRSTPVHRASLKENRKYHLTQVRITVGSNQRLRNRGGRQETMPIPYQIRRCNTSIRTHVTSRKDARHVFQTIRWALVWGWVNAPGRVVQIWTPSRSTKGAGCLDKRF